MTTPYEPARTPDDITRLWVERANAGDAAGLAALYEEDATMAFPADNFIRGRSAIQAAFQHMLDNRASYPHEELVPTVVSGDLALTGTISQDGSRGRAQVARRQPDGTWLRILHSSGYADRAAIERDDD